MFAFVRGIGFREEEVREEGDLREVSVDLDGPGGVVTSDRGET